MKTIYGTHYSNSTISNISKGFHEQMVAWRSRDLDEHYIAFYIDGLFVKLKKEKSYKNVGLLHYFRVKRRLYKRNSSNSKFSFRNLSRLENYLR